MRLKRTWENPPGGWRYRDPDTGFYFRHYQFKPFMMAIRKHRQANNLTTDADWQADFEHCLCKDLNIEGKLCGQPEPVKMPRKGGPVGVPEIRRFLNVFRKWLQTGFEFVPQELANTRAETCATCSKNLMPRGCTGCSGVGAAIKSLRVNRRTPYDKRLKACSICGCVLGLKVHFPAEVNISSAPKDAEWPEHCWMVTEGITPNKFNPSEVSEWIEGVEV